MKGYNYLNELSHEELKHIIISLDEYTDSQDLLIDDLRENYIHKREYQQLQNNWNELKSWLKRFDLKYLHETCEHNLADTIEVLLDKMQEIESRK